MAWRPYEKWLERGVSFLSFLARFLGICGALLTMFAIYLAVRRLGFGVEIASGLFLVAIWALSEMVRVKIVHERYKKAHPHQESATHLASPNRSSAVVSAAEASAAKVPQKGGIRDTPEELWDLFKEKTDLQAQADTAEYDGKWIEVTGVVEKVGSWNGNYAHVAFHREGGAVSMFFTDKHWLDRLSVLNQITVRGQILKLERQSLSINDCELVEGKRAKRGKQ